MKYRRAFRLIICALPLAMLAGCQYPAYISSRFDIAMTSRNETHIVILKLPADEFPLLARFNHVYEMRLENDATDEKLRILAQIRFPSLGCLTLPKCSAVTDKGIEYLLHLPSIESFGFSGKSITDRAIDTMIQMPNLKSFGVDENTGVTISGLVKLVQMTTMEDLFIPALMVTQEDLLRIIAASRHLNRIDIDEPAEGQFDAPALRRAAAAKKIDLYVYYNRMCEPL